MAIPSEAVVGAAPATEAVPNETEKTWAMAAHLGSLLMIGFIAPLVVMLTKGTESAFIRKNAVESLNFQLTAAAAFIVSSTMMMVLIGFITTPLLALAYIAFTVLGGIKAYQGESYRYPVCVRLVK